MRERKPSTRSSDALWNRTPPMIKTVSRRTPMSNDVSLDINQKSNPVQTVAPPKEDNNMLRATDKITALYCRLSVEDTKEKGGKDDPSNSIQHQQIMLMEYAKSQHFPNPTFFILFLILLALLIHHINLLTNYLDTILWHLILLEQFFQFSLFAPL